MNDNWVEPIYDERGMTQWFWRVTSREIFSLGNNVQIGGGSGVIKNIPDNIKVMGYPATEIKNFLKEIRNKND